jgi:hypothetical protein
MALFQAGVFLAAGAAVGWALRGWSDGPTPGHSRAKPVTERQAQAFVGAPTTRIPATPGGYGGLVVPQARVRL